MHPEVALGTEEGVLAIVKREEADGAREWGRAIVSTLPRQEQYKLYIGAKELEGGGGWC